MDEKEKILDINRKRDQNNFLGTTDDIKNITQNRKRCESDPGPSKGGCGYFKQRHKFNSLSRG